MHMVYVMIIIQRIYEYHPVRYLYEYSYILVCRVTGSLEHASSGISFFSLWHVIAQVVSMANNGKNTNRREGRSQL